MLCCQHVCGLLLSPDFLLCSHHKHSSHHKLLERSWTNTAVLLTLFMYSAAVRRGNSWSVPLLQLFPYRWFPQRDSALSSIYSSFYKTQLWRERDRKCCVFRCVMMDHPSAAAAAAAAAQHRALETSTIWLSVAATSWMMELCCTVRLPASQTLTARAGQRPHGR